MTWYPGEEGADALADMLVGVAEPSGRLPVTFPARVEDGPAGLGVEGERYPGIEGKVVYGEGVLVGYRFYETTRLAPLFPFGFGLSYGDMVVGGRSGRWGSGSSVTVVNNGHSPGHRGRRRSTCGRPSPWSAAPTGSWSGSPRSSLDPGERQTVQIPLGAAAFRYWDVDAHAWRSDPGRYEVLVGTSSRDIRASTEILWGDLATT